MNNKNKFFHVYLILNFSNIFASNWTTLIYMDSTDDLSDMAIKNITDMAFGGSSENSKILVQLHAYNNIGIRYKIENKNIIVIDQVKLTNNSKQDFVDAAQWAFGSYKSTYNMLVIWNHGYGILDPLYNKDENQWEIEPDLSLEHLYDNICKKKKSKGFGFNSVSKKYLTNQDLVESLDQITKTLGKKIDIFGFDTCMGAMLEISYQISPFVNFHIGAQDFELKDGWDYKTILKNLKVINPNPKELSCIIVDSYENYNSLKDKETIYTQSAIDLQFIQELSSTLDNLITDNFFKKTQNKTLMKNIVKLKETNSLMPIYIDLLNFCENLQKIDTINDFAIRKSKAVIDVINKMVIKKCCTPALKKLANGLSIYLPNEHIDNSYYETIFAKETKWLDFLKFMVN